MIKLNLLEETYFLENNIFYHSNERLHGLFLIKNGFLVFTNTSPNGLIDIIAVNDKGKVFLIDVKTITHRKKYKYLSKKEINRCPTASQKKMGVIIMMIDDKNIKFSPSDCDLAKIIKKLQCQ